MDRPTSVERTHQELLGLLVAAERLPGKTGVLAQELARSLQPHLDLEDECALPLLGLLQTMARGRMSPAEARKASRLYSKMKREYSHIIQQHHELGKLIGELKTVGIEEGHPTAVRFTEQLERHAQDEEELLFPAALLVGRLATAQK